jgi:hypothetical protein
MLAQGRQPIAGNLDVKTAAAPARPTVGVDRAGGMKDERCGGMTVSGA